MSDELISAEQERWLSGWSAANFPTARDNAEYHYWKHATDLSFWEYVCQAVEFPRATARSRLQPDGTILYQSRDGRFVIDRQGLVVTYGWNRS
jgi:hypothetical protein